MSLEKWEATVLARDGARDRVSAIEHELRCAAGLVPMATKVGLVHRVIASSVNHARRPR